MNKDDFVEKLVSVVNPWLNARCTDGIGPRLINGNDGKFYLYRVIDSKPAWSIDINLCVDILNSKNAITVDELIHGISLCLEARIDNHVNW